MRKVIISFIIVQEVKRRPQRAWFHKNSQIYAITKGDFIMGIRRVENMCGGKGHVIIKDILEGDELKGKCGLYAQVTIEKGCSLGYHEHHGETETYYILSGEGEYDDNGVKRPVKAGDITITPDGKGHGLANTGETDLVFMALIIFD